MIIAVDFDGTCVTHDYPNIGKDIGSVPILKELSKNHKLILYTMRSSKNGTLQEAIDWFVENDIPLFGIQKNPSQKIWTDSPKAYAEIYIDDAALGCPLIEDLTLSDRPFVDWKIVKKILMDRKIL